MTDGQKTFGDIINIKATKMVVISDAWSGLNEHAPIVASYELHRGAGGELVVKGRLRTSLAAERLLDIAVPAGSATRFLDAIAGAKIIEGPYQPSMMWTDDFPHIEIAMCVGIDEGHGGGVLLFTESQGEFHAPWGARVDGRIWTVPGEEVGRALSALRVPLKRSTLNRMMRESDRRRAGR